ncbi:hypothetical protein GCM10011390_36770 [Aureimonas endophytica]|uniref:Lipoprotein n=1 Tax=Aureimonas endophytica TaxID=2027858 RepID=A0A917EA74_9HYPH|nr:hypothetical protein [Aureimonas endophytica]GGE14248.1 hypothetical protein GCM10011390_36770 [Aureimonas endophytica]
MPLVRRRLAALLAAPFLLSACGPTQRAADLGDAPRRPVSADAEGVVPEYCPRITLREGTSILRKGQGEAMQYIASITQTTRECHVVDGELRMKVGVAGRVVTGPNGQGGTAVLPIRVAVTRGPDVLYTNKGNESVTYAQGATGRFAYVDEMVRVPEPSAKNYSVFVGFDEAPDEAGKPKSRRK